MMESKIKKKQIYLSSLTLLELKATLIRMLRGNFNLIPPISRIINKLSEENKIIF